MNSAPTLVAVSLKLYLDHEETLDWSRRVAALVRERVELAAGDVELAVFPSTPSLVDVRLALAGTSARLGAQDVSWASSGPYTGEVSARQLRQVGCRYVEVGHAERRRLFGDDDERVALKTAAAVGAGLVPLLCVGETERVDPAAAAAESIRQLRSARARIEGPDRATEIVIAYEPVWAIGAVMPAPVDHVRTVAQALRAEVAGTASAGRVIYGGSAGPGLLADIGDAVDGLFLGRYAHDVQALGDVLSEAAEHSRIRGSASR